MIWFLLNNGTPAVLGLIPSFLSETDPRSAAKQIDAHYISGWRPQPGFSMRTDGALLYPGDPPMLPLALFDLRREIVRVYKYGYASITQPDGSFEVCLLD